MLKIAVAALALLLVLAGCDGAGVMRTDDGRWVGLSPANVRDQVEATIDGQVDRELGAHWRCATSIAELPYRDTDEWSWRAATARVELVGDGAAVPPIADDEVKRAVTAYLAHKVDSTRKLTVTVARVVDPARLARIVAQRTPADRRASEAATPAAGAAPTAAPAGPTRYTVQSGDTLAAISSVFYGSPQQWRRIVDANPGLDPAHLPVGTAIVIPSAQ